MIHTILRSWAIVAFALLLAGMSVPLLTLRADEPQTTIVITEVMANALDEDAEEFIELYNSGNESVDLALWTFTDGDALDAIIPWSAETHGALKDPDAVVNTSVLPAGAYAVIVDSEYATTDQRYEIPNGTLILTVENTTLGNGLTTTDAVTLFHADGTVASTYGTPVSADTWQERDDDGLDAIPLNPGDGISVERVVVAVGDLESNWETCASVFGHTFGGPREESEQEVPEDEPDQDDPDVPLDPDDPTNPDDPQNPNDPTDPDDPDYETGDVRLSEVLPNPEGADADGEFIELYNADVHAVDLFGWVVADAAREYVIGSRGEDTIIASRGYYVVRAQESGIALNNSTPEVVRLVDPFEIVKSQIEYDRATEGESYARIGGAWEWTNRVTPGVVNDSSDIDDPEDDPENVNNDDNDLPDNEEPDDEDEKEEFDLSRAIRISEIVPNPVGSDDEEWIELENTGAVGMDVRGWTVTDGTTFYRVEKSTMINAHQFLVLKRKDTKITLNNSADELYLVNPAQEILEGVAWSDASEGEAFARGSDQRWHWTVKPTLGAANIVETPESDDENEPSEGRSTQSSILSSQNPSGGAVSSDARSVVTIGQVIADADGANVIVEGSVTVVPGTINDRVFYIQDDSAGIQIYSHYKQFPEGLSEGVRVRVTGVRSTASGEPRVKISSASSVVLLGAASVEPKELAPDDIAALIGRYVHTTGEIVGLTSGRAQVLVSGSEVAVAPGAFVVNEGDAVEVWGVVVESRSGPMIAATNIEQTESATSSTAGETSPGSAVGVSSDRSTDTPEVLGASISSFWSSGWSHAILPAGIFAILLGVRLYRRKQEVVLVE